MPRTTIDIDGPLLDEIRRIQKEEGVSMGRVVSRLLAQALAERRAARRRERPPALRWVVREMKPLVDLADKEAVYAALDRDEE